MNFVTKQLRQKTLLASGKTWGGNAYFSFLYAVLTTRFCVFENDLHGQNGYSS